MLGQIVEGTQKGLILEYMQKHPTKRVLVSDFQGGFLNPAPFVGYKANTRINELEHMGLVQAFRSEKKNRKGTPFAEYELTQAGLTYTILGK